MTAPLQKSIPPVVNGSERMSLDKLVEVVNFLQGAASDQTQRAARMYELDAKISALQAKLDAVNGSLTGTVNSAFSGYITGFKNKLINGNFDIWQRGTSRAAGTQNLFTADRWRDIGQGSTVAISRQAFTVGQTEVPGEPTYFHRTVVASVAGANNLAALQQSLEDVRTFAGRTVTLSFYAKADSAKNIAVELAQYFGTGGSPSAAVIGIGVTKLAISSAWAKYALQMSVPPLTGKTIGTNGDHSLQLTFWFDAGSSVDARTAALGQQSGTFDIAQVQLEAGSVASAFDARPYGVELLLCQRYYYKLVNPTRTNLPTGLNQNTTNNYSIVHFPTQMRVAPAVTVNGPWRVLVGGGAAAVTSFSVAEIGAQAVTIIAVTSGLTTGQAGIIQGADGSGANANVEFNSEI